VAGDADDPASLERAFVGAHGAFLVTNFWEHFSTERELTQAVAMARATKAAGVAHAVWSTLEDPCLSFPLDDPRLKPLQGKYRVPHFDAKGEADARGLPADFLAVRRQSGPTRLIQSLSWGTGPESARLPGGRIRGIQVPCRTRRV
jgi:hypothetical protein